MIEVAKAFKLQSIFYSARFIFPYLYAVYMYKIMILLNTFQGYRLTVAHGEIGWVPKNNLMVIQLGTVKFSGKTV